jgi:SlyX protein
MVTQSGNIWLKVDDMKDEELFTARLTELEIRTTLSDDLLEQLNKTVFRQQQQIESLAREINTLRKQMPQERNNSQPGIHDEIPPHY